MVANLSITNVTQIEKIIKAGATKDTSYPISGFKGLELRIRPSGKVEFRHRYTHPITGKRPYMTLGDYPAFSLAQAKQAYNQNQVLIEQGIDPLTHREQETAKQAHALDNTFEAVAKDWITYHTTGNDLTVTAKTVENWQNLLKPLIKELGKYPIDSITTPQVLKLFRDIQKTHIQKGNRVKGMASRIFAHAVINGLIEHNPVLQLTGARALKPTRTKHHPAITEPKELAELLRDIDRLPATATNFNREILQLLALTFTRINDLCAMKWTDIDPTASTWTFSPQKGVNRSDMVESLVVPLAPQAMAIIERLRPITGGMDYVFYNGRRKEAPYTDKQRINDILNDPSMNSAGVGEHYCGRGYKDVHSPHGFRATARTMLEEQLDFDYRLIEMQLGHNVRDVNGRAYNRVRWLDKRHDLMQAWANYLDDLKAGKVNNIIYLEKMRAKLQVNE